MKDTARGSLALTYSQFRRMGIFESNCFGEEFYLLLEVSFFFQAILRYENCSKDMKEFPNVPFGTFGNTCCIPSGDSCLLGNERNIITFTRNLFQWNNLNLKELGPEFACDEEAVAVRIIGNPIEDVNWLLNG